MIYFEATSDKKARLYLSPTTITNWSQCQRYVQYRSIEGYGMVTESRPAIFGSAVHAALNTYYRSASSKRYYDQIPVTTREIVARPLSKEETTELKRDVDNARMQAIIDFVYHMQQKLETPNEGEVRNIKHGITILTDYFEKYERESWVVCKDKNGKLCSEIKFDLKMTEIEGTEIYMRGRIDLIIEEAGRIYIVDHKTSARAGRTLAMSMKPNTQLTTYIYAARKLFGFDCWGAYINMLQVLKTKINNERPAPTLRMQHDFDELQQTVEICGAQMLVAIHNGGYVPNMPAGCTAWGGCPYIMACNAAPGMRTGILEQNFKRTTEVG